MASKISTALFTASLVLLAGAASAEEPIWNGPIPPAQANWLRLPGAEDLANLYPDRARRNRVTGKATVRCAVLSTGMLDRCAVTEEEPAGYGFGDATVKVVRHFRMGGRFGPEASTDVPMRWVLP